TVAGAATKQEITILKRGYMPFTTSFTPDKQNVVVVYKGTRYSRHNTRPMDMRKPMVVPMVIMTVKVVKPMVMKPVNTNSNPDKPDF
ncbi:hypothetical protein KJ865_07305, partial [Myxococcota bacterium]|nr:hypothetical protein [Myxococcota bacterium]